MKQTVPFNFRKCKSLKLVLSAFLCLFLLPGAAWSSEAEEEYNADRELHISAFQTMYNYLKSKIDRLDKEIEPLQKDADAKKQAAEELKQKIEKLNKNGKEHNNPTAFQMARRLEPEYQQKVKAAKAAEEKLEAKQKEKQDAVKYLADAEAEQKQSEAKPLYKIKVAEDARKVADEQEAKAREAEVYADKAEARLKTNNSHASRKAAVIARKAADEARAAANKADAEAVKLEEAAKSE